MKRRMRMTQYQRPMGSTERRLPDGRKLIVRTDQDLVVVDREGQELAVLSSELMALIALSEMSVKPGLATAEGFTSVISRQALAGAIWFAQPCGVRWRHCNRPMVARP